MTTIYYCYTDFGIKKNERKGVPFFTVHLRPFYREFLKFTRKIIFWRVPLSGLQSADDPSQNSLA